jgi:hypothetical protein
MGARLNAVFHNGDKEKPTAVVYGHWAGDDPTSATETLTEFFKAVEEQTPNDRRFNDPSYLAAKYVVFLAHGDKKTVENPLDFLSVGVVRNEKDCGPECIAYVDCSNGDNRPTISFDKN